MDEIDKLLPTMQQALNALAERNVLAARFNGHSGLPHDEGFRLALASTTCNSTPVEPVQQFQLPALLVPIGTINSSRKQSLTRGNI